MAGSYLSKFVWFRVWGGLLGRVAAAMLVVLLLLVGCDDILQRAEYDVLAGLTAPAHPHSGVVIIGIDEPSLTVLEQGLPVARRLHAHLLDNLRAAGALAVGFDLLFAEPTNPEDDAALRAALARAAAAGMRVVLAEAEVQVRASQVAALQQRRVTLFAPASGGLVNVPADRDGAVRRVPAAPDAFWRLLAGAAGVTSEPPRRAYLRYYAPEYPLPYWHLYQALEPERYLPPEALRGRIVVVGQNTPILHHDRFPSPLRWLGPDTMAGAEIHATAVFNALAGDWVTAYPQALALLVAVLIIMVLAALTRRWQPGRAALLFLATLVVLAGAGLLLFALGIWLALWPALVAMLALYNIDAAWNYWTQWRGRERLKALFASYLAPAVVQALAERGDFPTVGGEQRELTLLFADLANFTQASEQMSADAVAQALNHYFTAMTSLIHAHQGTLDKFIGDAVMAFWNAPLDQPDHRELALRCAVQMNSALQRLRADWPEDVRDRIHLRIGIHTGTAAVGHLGSIQRFTYTAVGDTVNTAARLEGANKRLGSQILVSEATAQAMLATPDLPLAWLDRIQVAGRKQPLDVFSPVVHAEAAALTLQLRAAMVQGDVQHATELLEQLQAAVTAPDLWLHATVQRLRTRLAARQHPAPGSRERELPAKLEPFDFVLALEK